jgi:hypothetical protein
MMKPEVFLFSGGGTDAVGDAGPRSCNLSIQRGALFENRPLRLKILLLSLLTVYAVLIYQIYVSCSPIF